MNIGCLSIYMGLPYFLSAVFCSFQCVSLLSPLNLFLSILFFGYNHKSFSCFFFFQLDCFFSVQKHNCLYIIFTFLKFKVKRMISTSYFKNQLRTPLSLQMFSQSDSSKVWYTSFHILYISIYIIYTHIHFFVDSYFVYILTYFT